jgi:hypothetical protein
MYLQTLSNIFKKSFSITVSAFSALEFKFPSYFNSFGY